MPFRSTGRLAGAWALVWLLAVAEVADAASVAGRPLADALRELEARGLRIIFSDSLVRPEMVVAAEPTRDALQDALEDVLSPFRLTARGGPQGSWLVVPQSSAGRLRPAPLTAPRPVRAVFPSRVDWVDLRALVTRRGRPVRGLKSSAFQVRDDGVLQNVEVVAVDDPDRSIPVQVVLALDHSDSMRGEELAILKAEAARFLDALPPENSVSLVSFATSVASTPDGESNRCRVLDDLESTRAEGSTALYDAVYVALQRAAAPGTQSILVVLSDGEDTGSWLTAANVLEVARESDVMVYGIEQRRQKGESVFLRDLAQVTGGTVWRLDRDGDLAQLLSRAVEQARWTYRLRFEPRGVKREGVHDISVRCTAAFTHVRARRTYALPAENAAPPEEPLAPSISERLAPLAPTTQRPAAQGTAWPTGAVTGWGRPGDRPLCRTPGEPPPRDEYRHVIDLYREGRGAEASSLLSGCAAASVSRLLPEAMRDAALLPIAVALHTETALRLADAGRHLEAATHLELVESHALVQLRRLDAGRRVQQGRFWREWLLALGLFHQGRGEMNAAARLYGVCLELFPDEALAWLAAGTVEETTSEASPDLAATRRETAEKYYRAALARDPALDEAHLRLARVLLGSGHPDEVTTHLEWVTTHGHDPLLVGAGWLFRARLAERRGDLAGALEAYGFAREISPELQPALIGLSYASHRSGLHAVAREWLRGLPAPSDPILRDPWQGYRRGLAHDYGDAFTRWCEESNRLRRLSGS